MEERNEAMSDDAATDKKRRARRLLVAYLIGFTLGGAVVAVQLVTGAQISLAAQTEATDAPSVDANPAAAAGETNPDGESDASGAAPEAPTAEVSFLILDFRVSGITLVLVYIAALGMIGGAMQGIRAVAQHRIDGTDRGDDQAWNSSYSVWYVVLPLLGSVNALILYLVIAAGFIGSVGDTASLNFYGVSALAIFGGLFSQKTFRKFSDIFDVAVGVADTGSDTPTGGDGDGTDETPKPPIATPQV